MLSVFSIYTTNSFKTKVVRLEFSTRKNKLQTLAHHHFKLSKFILKLHSNARTMFLFTTHYWPRRFFHVHFYVLLILLTSVGGKALVLLEMFAQIVLKRDSKANFLLDKSVRWNINTVILLATKRKNLRDRAELRQPFFKSLKLKHFTYVNILQPLGPLLYTIFIYLFMIQIYEKLSAFFLLFGDFFNWDSSAYCEGSSYF